MRGDFAEAERFTAEAVAVADGVRGSMAPMIVDAQTFLLRRSQGRHHDLEPFVRSIADRRPAMLRWRCVLALLLAEVGRVDEARNELDQLAERDFASLQRNASWLLAVSVLAELCTLLGDRSRARCLYELLVPYEGRNVIAIGAAYYGPVARFLGLLAMTIGEDERALGHLETARSAAERMGARPTAVVTALDAAEVLARRGAPGDAERASALVSSVEEEVERLRMDGAIARLADLRERLAHAGEHEVALGEPRPIVARLRREDDLWLLVYDGRSVRLQDAKGLRHLAALLARPGTPIAAVTLAAAGRAGAPDAEAQRERVAELRDELSEARAFNDPERAARASAQLEALAAELAAGELEDVPRERARLNVTRAIRAAVRRIAEHEPELGHRLQRTIRTGTSCAYRPETDPPLHWDIRA
jgi:tetratricopeptide (TPR) repeat protein